MIAMELAHATWSHVVSLGALVAVPVHAIAGHLAATPSPKPTGSIATDHILGFLASKIAPILLAVLGVIFIGRASKGEVSKVLTSSAIAILGLAFVLGAGALLIFGDSLVNLVFE